MSQGAMHCIHMTVFSLVNFETAIRRQREEVATVAALCLSLLLLFFPRFSLIRISLGAI